MLTFGISETRRIFYAGESATLYIESTEPFPEGKAVLRTNIGMAALRRREIIEQVEKHRRPAGRDWRDLEMHRVSPTRFEKFLMFSDTGTFAMKPFFAPAGSKELQWPEGDNLSVKVEAAENIGANLMYTAFVRQFGPNCTLAHSPAEPASAAELDKEGYTLIPPSGHFRDLIKKLDFIFGELGCRILQLLPIHPAPTVYGRMGRFGSPFASLDYFSVDPALADFDPTATPLEQFGELVDAVHARKGRIFLDIPVNHTGWASRLQTEHPEWFVRDAQTRRIESPGAWGVVWADLCKLDYEKTEVQHRMAEVFLYWCRKGVDGFRCDAGYMLPIDAWRYIEAKVRAEYPDTVFMLEGLGGPLDKQEKLLRECGLDWAYSELFQNYHRSEIERYVEYASRIGREAGTLINFAETHDNNRLAATSPLYAKMRCAVTAFLSDGGAFGFTNGVEWFATEKIDVHGAGALNWGNPVNMVDFLRHLHAAMRLSPAFYGGAEKRLENLNGDNALAIFRKRGDARLCALVNLDCERTSRVRVRRSNWENGSLEAFDLISEQPFTWQTPDADTLECELAPGATLLLSANREDLTMIQAMLAYRHFRTPDAVRRQKLFAAAQKAYLAAGLPSDVPSAEAAKMFSNNWRGLFLARPVVVYFDPADGNRLLAVPPGWCIAIVSDYAFRAELKSGETTVRFERSIHLPNGKYLAVLAPVTPVEMPENDMTLELTDFTPEGVERRTGHVRCLPVEGHGDPIVMQFKAATLEDAAPRHALGTNHLGGYFQVQSEWGLLRSKYDALLAANLNSDYPVERRVMLSRCRAWVVLNGFSQEVNFYTEETFRIGKRNLARWEFELPVGQGRVIRLDVTVRMALDANAVKIEFRRRGAGRLPRFLADRTAVRLIVRPDLDDRDNHGVTKAYAGAEQRFPAAIRAFADGFDFVPAPERRLTLQMPGARFAREDEWHYSIHLPAEAYYGLEHETDCYSPGYFEAELAGGETFTITAAANPDQSSVPHFPETDDFPNTMGIMEAATNALDAFVVKRNEFHTVMAGYPWFLDWGRDTFIALRGLIAAGKMEAAHGIILQFAGFEKSGTIPNMIRGDNDSNRDTSDAPLWLAVAVSDYCRAAGNEELLQERAGKSKRTVLEILISIAEHYKNGTPNGIHADAASNLVYSPPHFTWMDTNYPAATPREGYPVEIQSLWFALQSFLGRFDKRFAEGAEATRNSILNYYWLPEERYLSDCLHGAAQTPAAQAVRDNALRPNQLFAVTLGVVTEHDKVRGIVEATGELVIPGAIRTLSTDEVTPPQPVYLNGRLLNDPTHPYRGRYCGPEDTSRKVAYHNGTAWCWPFPSFVEAVYMMGGETLKPAAKALLESASEYFNGGCPGQLPEVADGDYPHNWGGCAAQVWSVSEFYRVGKLLGME